METNMQNFDLYDLGGSTAADMHDGPRPIEPTIRRVVGEHADDVEVEGFEPMIHALIDALTPLMTKG